MAPIILVVALATTGAKHARAHMTATSADRKGVGMMEEFKVKDWFEFLSFVNKFKGPGFIFRGVSSTNYQLIPKVGRERFAQQ